MSRSISTVNLIEPFFHRLDLLLADNSEGLHISIYQEAGRTYEDAVKSRLNFESRIQSLKRNPLISKTRSEKEINHLFEAADEIVDDTDFWERHHGGLAFFIQEETTETVKVPCSLPERSVVSSRFHLKPLMALAANSDAYYLLNLSPNKIRLYRGSRLGIHETHVPGLPKNYASFVKDKGIESDVDHDLDQLPAYFEEIDRVLMYHLANHDWPLLLSGVDYYEPIYREISRYPHLSKSYLAGNTEDMDLNDLHAEASQVLHGEFIESQKRTLIRYKELKGSSHTESDLKHILEAVFRGQVEIVIVPHDRQVWGIFNGEDLNFHRTTEPNLHSQDLFEVAARETLARGGEVYFLEAAQLPRGTEAVAILRSPLKHKTQTSSNHTTL